MAEQKHNEKVSGDQNATESEPTSEASVQTLAAQHDYQPWDEEILWFGWCEEFACYVADLGNEMYVYFRDLEVAK